MTNPADYKNLSDNNLLHLISKNDYQAFDEIYHRYIERLYPYSNKLNIDAADSDDVLQEVFTSLWTRRASLTIDNLEAWLFMSVRNQMLLKLRKKKYTDKYAANILNFVVPFYDPVTEVIQEKQVRAFIEEELNKLPARMQEIFRMSRQDYLTHKEIAQKLNLSEKTVRKQISNVLKIFRSKLTHNRADVVILLTYYFLEKK